MDVHAAHDNDDQRGRIIGSCVAIFIITDIFVLLRLVSRKLAQAGYWVSFFNFFFLFSMMMKVAMMVRSGMDADGKMCSGMMFWLLLRW